MVILRRSRMIAVAAMILVYYSTQQLALAADEIDDTNLFVEKRKAEYYAHFTQVVLGSHAPLPKNEPRALRWSFNPKVFIEDRTKRNGSLVRSFWQQTQEIADITDVQFKEINLTLGQEGNAHIIGMIVTDWESSLGKFEAFANSAFAKRPPGYWTRHMHKEKDRCYSYTVGRKKVTNDGSVVYGLARGIFLIEANTNVEYSLPRSVCARRIGAQLYGLQYKPVSFPSLLPVPSSLKAKLPASVSKTQLNLTEWDKAALKILYTEGSPTGKPLSAWDKIPVKLWHKFFD